MREGNYGRYPLLGDVHLLADKPLHWEKNPRFSSQFACALLEKKSLICLNASLIIFRLGLCSVG